MSLTIFLALAILGCDVLIYFLYEWAFGESKRIRKRRASSHLWADTAVGRQGHLSRAEGTRAATPPVIMLDRKGGRRTSALALPNPLDERLAYRRMAASFAQLKPRI
ncbi:MAG TPA: hypothetical protein VED66_08160 [Candidatus Sulfotelmatobacter sp.]|nr:hypothetical protein [Candidatus Sulfotelmatobacter sp.]